MPLMGTALRMASQSGPTPSSDPMVLVFDTSLEAGEQITLPLAGTVNCTVDWGDSSTDDYTTTGNKTHTYSTGGTYTVEITGILTQFGTAGAYANVAKLTQCTSFGGIGLTSVSGAFYNAANLTVAPSSLPSTVQDISVLFFGCTSFNSANITGWGISNVTAMNGTFFGCTSFNQNIGSWSTGNVTDFRNLFSGATAFNQTLSWNTAAAQQMGGMFNNATSFVGGGVSGFDLSSLAAATSMNSFAAGCTFSTANYDAILIAWEADKTSYRTDLSPSFGNSQYTAGGAAATARAALVTYGWTITDGGTA